MPPEIVQVVTGVSNYSKLTEKPQGCEVEFMLAPLVKGLAESMRGCVCI